MPESGCGEREAGMEEAAAARPIDCWFTMGSTYTCLTVARLEDAGRVAGVTVRWRPFKNVLALTGATQLPFLEGTAKMRYMWRDIERRAVRYGLPIRLPVPYPVPSSLRANRVALVGMREGWGPAYMRAAYRLWFGQGIGNGGEENLRASLAECGQGQDIDRILSLADGEEVGRELDAATEEARALGVFGSPTFAVGTELFWGDDHLEDAIQWARQGRLEAV
jgi:2-hydroxychromene-2-carboxylate isomerase